MNVQNPIPVVQTENVQIKLDLTAVRAILDSNFKVMKSHAQVNNCLHTQVLK